MNTRGIGCAALFASVVVGQSSWNRPAVTNPPPVRAHAMVFDSARQVVVAHGSQTWEWDGSNWIARNLPLVPNPARLHFAMAFDRSRSVTVLHGGAYHGDTWEYDGTTWRDVSTMGGPGVRCCAAMTYDWIRQRVLLFGGYTGNQMLDDTWEWDGTTWTQRMPATRPAARCCGDMAFDLGRAVAVLFGGALDSSRIDSDETWEWNGVDWRLVSPLVRPPSRRGAQYLEYDLLGGRIFLHGGGSGSSGAPLYNDTWEFDGRFWSARQPSTLPTPAWLHAMAFDEARGHLFRNGGILTGGAANETWIFQAASSAAFRRYGASCAGSAGQPFVTTETGPPWLGQTFTLQVAPVPASAPGVLAIGRSSTSWNGVPLPISLASAGMPGCFLLVGPVFFVPLATTGGSARWSPNLPSDLALVGASVYAQGFVSDPGANALGLISSDGGVLTFGIL